MTAVDSRTPFFPKSKSARTQIEQLRNPALKRNSYERADEISKQTVEDARVNIPDAIKDFSRIKKAVDMAPPIDNSDKVARLKQQINEGSYEVDYDALADKLLASEM